MRLELGRERCMSIHLTLVPWIASAGELKTKPTQHSVREMRSIGIQPDILVCRCEQNLPLEVRRKIALFCNVDEERVIDAADVESIYEVPLRLREQNMDGIVMDRLKLSAGPIDLTGWAKIVGGV